jgi:hypothetical protein
VGAFAVAAGKDSIGIVHADRANSSLDGGDSSQALWRHRARHFIQGIICDDVSEFESHMPSQPVRSLRAMSGLQKYVRHSRDLARGRVVSDPQFSEFFGATGLFRSPVSRREFSNIRVAASEKSPHSQDRHRGLYCSSILSIGQRGGRRSKRCSPGLSSGRSSQPDKGINPRTHISVKDRSGENPK